MSLSLSSFIQPAEKGLTFWYEAKTFVEHSTSISTDALHVIAGVLTYVLCAIILRMPISSSRLWLLLLVVTGFNEFVDLWVERWPEPAMQYGEGAKDLFLTMFLPTVLLLTGRWLPDFYRPARSSARTWSGR